MVKNNNWIVNKCQKTKTTQADHYNLEKLKASKQIMTHKEYLIQFPQSSQSTTTFQTT